MPAVVEKVLLRVALPAPRLARGDRRIHDKFLFQRSPPSWFVQNGSQLRRYAREPTRLSIAGRHGFRGGRDTGTDRWADPSVPSICVPPEAPRASLKGQHHSAATTLPKAMSATSCSASLTRGWSSGWRRAKVHESSRKHCRSHHCPQHFIGWNCGEKDEDLGRREHDQMEQGLQEQTREQTACMAIASSTPAT